MVKTNESQNKFESIVNNTVLLLRVNRKCFQHTQRHTHTNGNYVIYKVVNLMCYYNYHYYGNHFTVYSYQIIMWYTLNLKMLFVSYISINLENKQTNLRMNYYRQVLAIITLIYGGGIDKWANRTVWS